MKQKPTLDLKNEPGWTGAFTRQQAQGALANGTRVVKTSSEQGDAHPDGTRGTVLGSISEPAVQNGATCYFIEWDPRPRTAVAAMAFKVRPATSH
jgi:hypothetical protein